MPNSYAELVARIRIPAGFALAAVYLVFARPTPWSLGCGAALSLLGLGLRAWSSGYIEKNQKLSTAGPYAHTRNPLYLGSAIAGAGYAIAGGQWWFFPLLALFLLAVYGPVIRREEAHLRRLFPEDYPAYAQAVPAFWFRLRAWRPPEHSAAQFRWRRYWHNREYEALLAYLALLTVLLVKIGVTRAY